MVTPMKAIRAKCLDCSCGSSNEVKLCPVTSCPLFPFREGRNPNIAKRELTEEQREAIKARLMAGRLVYKGEKSRNPATEGIYTTGTNAAESPADRA